MIDQDSAAGATLRDKALSTTIASSADSNPLELDAVWLDATATPDRYRRVDTLGEGGMGEVGLCTDRRVGREVAMKVIRAGHGSTGGYKARFLREARVQGQLEHPSIVPVYDIGVNVDGDAYFTMKRVRGLTLEQILEGLRDGDAEAVQKFSRRKLLSAIGTVCLTIDFAHSRGVVHRDLKPGNIMLGDFGEVYLLDWGIAKVMGTADGELAVATVRDTPQRQTVEGELMGTPGFMAPEQARGTVDAVGPCSDVFALGAILYEVLTLEPLVPISSSTMMVMAALEPVDARPSARAAEADVPPELEAICVRATAFSPHARFASAREISDAIERFLDGDRDLERRRELSRVHSETAARAATRAIAPDAPSDDARSEAMSAVGRALALDPGNVTALETLVSLLSNPPARMPPEAQRSVTEAHRELLRIASRSGSYAYFSWLAYAPLILWMGIRSMAAAFASGLMWLVAGAHAWLTSIRPPANGQPPVTVMVVSTLAVATTVTLFGPLFMLPALAVMNSMGYIASSNLSRRILAMALGCLAIVVPAGLELAGVLPRSYRFVDGAILIVPHMINFPPVATVVFLVVANVALLITPSLHLSRLANALERAETRMHVQAWQLRLMIPDAAKRAASEPPAAGLRCAAMPGWQHWRPRRVRA